MTCEAWIGDKRQCGSPATTLKERHNPSGSFPWMEPMPTNWEGPAFHLCEAHFAKSFYPPTKEQR